MNRSSRSRRPTIFKTIAVPLAAVLLGAGASFAVAAPVTYSFSTAAGPLAGSSGPAGLLGGNSFASGTFEYDALSPATGTTSAGMTFYGIQNLPGFPTSFLNLAGSVGGYAFSDARGTTVAGNDNFVLTDYSTTPPTNQLVDFVQLNTQSQTPTVGFSLGGYTLVNVRMFWIEGQQVPSTVPEFLANQNLPGVLPAFQGRLALDFAPTGNPTGPLSYVFYDGLAVTPVPEPETYAMLLAGLGLLALVARRRKAKVA